MKVVGWIFGLVRVNLWYFKNYVNVKVDYMEIKIVFKINFIDIFVEIYKCLEDKMFFKVYLELKEFILCLKCEEEKNCFYVV